MPDGLIALPVSCSTCHRPVTVEYRPSVQIEAVYPWICPLCRALNTLVIAGMIIAIRPGEAAEPT